ncbi:MAG: hypothetical protein ACK4MV_03875 [Beijerinckiaceae bacterium]
MADKQQYHAEVDKEVLSLLGAYSKFYLKNKEIERRIDDACDAGQPAHVTAAQIANVIRAENKQDKLDQLDL